MVAKPVKVVAKPVKVVAKPVKVVAQAAKVVAQAAKVVAKPVKADKVVAKPAKADKVVAKPAKATNKRSAEGASGGHSGEVRSSSTFQLYKSSLYAVHCSGSSERITKCKPLI